MKKKIFLILFMLTILATGTVNADEINKFYTNSNDSISLKDSVNGDAALAGKLIDVIGDINGIGFIAGDKVNVKGNLDHGFIAGYTVNVNGNIEKSLYLAGSEITFSKDATIGNDAFIVTNKITLNGNLKRDINIYGTEIIVKKGAIINGTAILDANKITIEDNVTIKGTLKYKENTTTVISDKANINDIEKIKADTQDNNKINTASLLAGIINLVIVFLVIALIMPKTTEKTDSIYDKKSVKGYFKNIGIGVLIAICVPLICLLLLISNIGIALGLIISILFGIALYLSFIITGYLFGKLVLIKWLKLSANKYLTGIIGIILLKLFTLIPIVGGIIIVISVTLGLATIFELIKEDEPKPKNKQIKEAKITPKKTAKKKITK